MMFNLTYFTDGGRNNPISLSNRFEHRMCTGHGVDIISAKRSYENCQYPITKWHRSESGDYQRK